ncbi:GNAT family N-acetyltransferase [Phycicoccus sonneratiae]|uniref:GNAT family N-acetyltransferase n=1 Tax=Phycicoccus sonneratiae TaxID=2807628 RepID=A0ABS2CIX2_9MICO|nr:GNAT family N-acetyltransferase [Phycicoccus sonneraticus]MBM6399735.1 GNAT family N-acetyltransferase [Phycicoccus sonneraticus]
MPDSAVVLRPAVDADVPALADLFLAVRADSVPGIPPLAHPPETVAPFLARVVASDTVWVAEENGLPVGFLALGRGGEVEHLYVRSGATGRGTGAALLALARAAHPEGLALWTFAANAGARRFYAREGFVEVGGTDGDNEEGAPDIRMEWRPLSAGGSPR